MKGYIYILEKKKSFTICLIMQLKMPTTHCLGFSLMYNII
jgi:hypothetical protein